MTLKRAANLILAMAMLLCAWFLLSGTSPRALWFNLSGSTAAREAALDDRYGLQVHYEKGTPALPALWQLPPVSGTAVPADAKCVAEPSPVHSVAVRGRTLRCPVLGCLRQWPNRPTATAVLRHRGSFLSCRIPCGPGVINTLNRSRSVARVAVA